MVRIDRIYTRNGDNGQTRLADGQVVNKDSLRVEAYGNVDELNAFVGAARTAAQGRGIATLVSYLPKLQNKLFDIGAILATSAEKTTSSVKCPDKNDVDEMEELIDFLIKDLPDLESFVLPGGNQLNSILHICRTVCRRVERSVLMLQHEENVPQEVIVYLNRLSDLFFAMARYASAQCGDKEYLWEPLS